MRFLGSLRSRGMTAAPLLSSTKTPCLVRETLFSTPTSTKTLRLVRGTAIGVEKGCDRGQPFPEHLKLEFAVDASI